MNTSRQYSPSSGALRRPRCLRFWPVALTVALVIAAAGWFSPLLVLGPVGQFLIVDEHPERADAIIVLLGGSSPDRVQRAAEIFKEGYAPKVSFGSGFTDTVLPKDVKWLPPSVHYEVALESLGLNGGQVEIVPSPSAYDTSSELEVMSRHARKSGWGRVILVSSALHTRRVKIIWNRVAPDIPSIVIAAPDPEALEWWRSGRELRNVGYEYGALVKELCRRVVSG